MSTPRLIIGLVGRIGSGKGTAAAYLRDRYGAAIFSFSDPLRDVLQRLNLEISRDHFVRLSECLRDTFGDELLGRVMALEATQANTPMVVIEGIRRASDLVFLREEPGFILVQITASPEERFKRLKKRAVKADDTRKTFVEFMEDDQRSTEATIDEVLQFVATTVENENDPSQLYVQLDRLVEEQRDRL